MLIPLQRLDGRESSYFELYGEPDEKNNCARITIVLSMKETRQSDPHRIKATQDIKIDLRDIIGTSKL